MELQQTIEIARPPADVYAFVATDHEKNHPRWDPAISDMRQQTPGPVAVGTEYTLDRKMMGRKTPMTIRITKMDPPRFLNRLGHYWATAGALCRRREARPRSRQLLRRGLPRREVVYLSALAEGRSHRPR